MTVADHIAAFLVSHGVRHVFGFQGSAMLKMLDSIAATGRIEYIQGFHEQASAFAADAYARMDGKPGVAIATSGPGASNMVTGIANAFFDSVPMLYLTGQDRRAHVASGRRCRQNGFQDMDIVSMSANVAKRSVQVLDGASLAAELDRCWTLAQTGRKGPALIDVPLDLQFEEMPKQSAAGRDAAREQPPPSGASRLGEAVDALKSSSRPVVLAGGGVRLAGCCGRLGDFARETRIPVVSTLMGLDSTEETLGFSGLYGNPLPNRVLGGADCIIALGTRFAFHQTGKDLGLYSSATKVIHVDVDATELGRVYRDAICVQADLNAFFDAVSGRGLALDIGDWTAQVGRWREELGGPPEGFPAQFLGRLFRDMPRDAVVVADVGSNQMWVAQCFVPNGANRLLNSGGLGAMGYSLPAAIGASYATRSPVVAVCGDGGFQMNVQELNTLALRRRNVKVFVFDNSALGLMRWLQRRYYGGRFFGNTEREFSCPDVCRLAAAFGLKTARVSSAGDFAKLQEVFEDDEPWLVDVVVDADDLSPSRYERGGFAK